LSHPAFLSGDISTYFLKTYYPEADSAAPRSLPLSPQAQQQLLALAAVVFVQQEAVLEVWLRHKTWNC
jgi:hypothetical protein